ncbi:hypothetical protein HMPREF9318_00311 [Streptococcus urinalis FB127-CNA-2]|uniref:Chloride transporter, ClC family n=1 Tax=Streptococcus urinalis 2285-97 TaxID=764291 RepID=G5KFQ1_9STRE|nr:ClC family H(+)/Cl(-) exchange transporter [Streptococcus urinalis]EHJ57399.1 chloride transporter, ClC family [Streptococcus urinalis 2285-97]EKS22113.1 hypothetical protein HMPREF9318_00311 [Streptococcus urinalis FB127-CNA-2]VEF31925.1 Voltage-gated chloride channel family protein [Streptococcus urinalis]
MENHRNEFTFSRQNILGFVWTGLLVGLVSGTVVSLFRLSIEKIFERVVEIYHQSHHNHWLLLLIIFVSLIFAFIIGFLVKSEPDIKGSGIPHVEGELKGMLHPNWWSVLWKKFIAGVLAISMGFMLGREGPSIQLGSMSAKGLSKWLKSSRVEKRVLIASGAAAGLSAAFNAPIAGLLFVVEEVYHHFSRLVWISALVASLVANFISLNIFGLHPVLGFPNHLTSLGLYQYWILPVMGIFLGLLGYYYEVIILRIQWVYQKLEGIFRLPQYLNVIYLVFAILPIGYYAPQLLGGGNGLIISMAGKSPTLLVALTYFIIRFIWSMLCYGSGLPGGIFLPILTLGSLAGLCFGLLFENLHLISHDLIPLFIVLGMSGYFGAISKAPLTGMILVTEMVGDMRQLMSIGVVTLFAYIIMDFLKGEPIYEAMLSKMSLSKPKELIEPTLIELTVSDKIAGKKVRDLHLPHNALITTQMSGKHSELVSGNTILRSGETIFLVVNEPDIAKIRAYFMET